MAICFVVSLAMIILFAFLKNEDWIIRILIFVFCGIFTIASGIILCQQLFFYVSVDDENFYVHFLFGFHKIPLRKIEKVSNIDGFYCVFADGKKMVNFAANTRESQQIIVFLERKKIKIDW